MPARVYLCGPMTGLSVKSANEWRVAARAHLPPPDFELISPLRGKTGIDYGTSGIPCVGKALEAYPALSQAPGIFGRDRFDVQRSDVLLANFLGAPRVSIGSCFELAWASLLQKPYILVMEPEGNPHDHVFVTQTATYRVASLEEGCALIKTMFGDR